MGGNRKETHSWKRIAFERLADFLGWNKGWKVKSWEWNKITHIDQVGFG